MPCGPFVEARTQLQKHRMRSVARGCSRGVGAHAKASVQAAGWMARLPMFGDARARLPPHSDDGLEEANRASAASSFGDDRDDDPVQVDGPPPAELAAGVNSSLRVQGLVREPRKRPRGHLIRAHTSAGREAPGREPQIVSRDGRK